MIPDLQVSVACEDVRQERSGKFMIIGMLDVIQVKQLPVVIPKLCIFSRWCCGQGEFTQRTRIIAPDDSTEVVAGKEIKIKLQNVTDYSTAVEIMMGVPLREEGTYWIETILDGDMKMRSPLTVRTVHQQT